MEKKTKVEKALDTKKSTNIVKGVGAIVCALVPPIYVFIRYKCWNFTTKICFSGWAILGVMLFVGALVWVLNNIIFGGKWAYWKQIIRAFIKVFLPCVAVGLIMYYSINYLKELAILVSVIGVFWTVAYILNPIPEMQYVEGVNEQVDTLTYAYKKIRNK